MGLDGFSLYAVINELNNILSGGRIDKICQPRRSDVYMTVRLPGTTYILHISIDPRLASMAISVRQPENPLEPPTFCMLLRKQLEGGRIAKIYQLGLDRVAVIEVDILGAGARLITKKLYIELMGKYSNIVLVENQRIIDSLKRVGSNSSRVRTVLPQQEYIPPPPQDSIDILTAADNFINKLKLSAGQSVYKAVLKTGAGFGPVTASEILFLAGLPDDMAIEKLDVEDFISLRQAIDEIITVYDTKMFVPTLIKDDNNKIMAMAAFPLHKFTAYNTVTFASMSCLLETAHRLADDYVSPEKSQLLKIVTNELEKQKNKNRKLAEQLQQAENAEIEKIKADNIMTYQYQFADHKDSAITVPNIYEADNAKLTISMDRRLTIVQNMQKYYNKYDKLRRGQKILAEQLQECRENTVYLETIEISLESSDTLSELADIKAELVKSGYLHIEKRKRTAVPESKPFKFISSDGMPILVGKNNVQNDKLTFKIADNDDIWLHVKNIPGSHVIIRTAGSDPAETTIEQAALLAAHYSKGKNSSNVPVDYTFCRFVKKPSGAKPGFVIFTNNKTLYVTPDETKLKTLFANFS
ncbi:NFACT family protein [Pectinatus frisingensis]|uniref:Rqc2 family fibronectin-binding protein n=1 Tax=Pectinatus frisingensis TaxID=865 RepID=UPI0018C4A609|nr:NFACT RNA binding domain-containing protein [Pectinatus frisingensis]